MKSIRNTVENWIAESELPSRAGLRAVSRFDNRYGYQRTDLHGDEAVFKKEEQEIEEAEAYWDFMHWAMSKEHQVLLSIPKPAVEYDFWRVELDELGNDVSAFNTIDYGRMKPFNKYQYKLSKVRERVKDLAQTYASVSDMEGKQNTFKKYKNLVEKEFRDRGVMLLETYKKYAQWIDRAKLAKEIAELNRQIRICNMIWQKHSAENAMERQ